MGFLIGSTALLLLISNFSIESAVISTYAPFTSTSWPQDCAGQPDGTYIRDPYDCASFYTCDNGIALKQHCPKDLLFNTELNVCDYPQNVDCGDRPIVTTTTSYPETTEAWTDMTTLSYPPESTSTEEPTTLPPTTTEEPIYTATETEPTEKPTPYPTETTSTEEPSAFPTETTSTEEPTAFTTTTPAPTEGPTANPTGTISTAGPTQYPTETIPTEKPPPSTSGYPTTTDLPELITNVPEIIPAEEPKDEVPVETNPAILCEVFPDGAFIPDSRDCMRYFRCYQKIAYSQSCPANLVWNAQTNMCDYGTNVNCRNKPNHYAIFQNPFVNFNGLFNLVPFQNRLNFVQKLAELNKKNVRYQQFNNSFRNNRYY